MPARRSRWSLALLPTMVAIVATACGGGTSEPKGNAAAAKISVVSGNGQVGFVGQTLLTPLSVKVTSSSGTPVAGATVTFTVTSGTASLSPGTTVTDATGVAKTNVTLGSSVGTVQINATVNGTTLVAAFVITIGTPNTTAACASSSPQTPAAGSVLAGVAGTGICLGGGTTGGDYALIPFFANPDNTASTTIQVQSQNAVALTVADVAPAFNVLAGGAAGLRQQVAGNPAQEQFDAKLRRIAREQLTPLIPSAQARLRQGMRPSFN